MVGAPSSKLNPGSATDRHARIYIIFIITFLSFIIKSSWCYLINTEVHLFIWVGPDKNTKNYIDLFRVIL